MAAPSARLWAVIAVLAAAGLLTAGWSLYFISKVTPVLSLGGTATLLGVFVLVLLAVPFSFGAGCIYLARLLAQGDRVARILALVLCLSAGAAFLITGDRSTTLVLLALLCLAIAAVLGLDPAVRRHFTGPDARYSSEPAPVIAARVLLVCVAGCILLVGVMFLPLAAISFRLAFIGLLYVAVAAGLLGISRGLARGLSTARVALTLLAVPYLLLAVIGGHGQPAVVLPIGLTLGVIGLLWLPSSSRTYFASRPRPTRRWLAQVERHLDPALRSHL